jgi:diaminopimelate epimerase
MSEHLQFEKYHALGNDYLVYAPVSPNPWTPQEVQRICHRNFGLGSDGILEGPLSSDKAPFGLKIWNPDGSLAEKSGNGLRIFSRYLFDKGLVSAEAPFKIETAGGIVSSTVHGNGEEVTVDMGHVSFHSDVIPVKGASREVLKEPITINGSEWLFSAATIGNPHCVLVLPDISAKLAHDLGPQLETHPLFPNRTNVQLVQVLDRSHIRIEIWERGAGYTLASGSSSSAAAAVCHKLGLVDSEVTVIMPGGRIQITIQSDTFHIRMRGGVTRVGSFLLNKEIFGFQAPNV